MATVINSSAPYGGLANLMALKGRMGDTELVHMSKPEIAGLASLGKLTINPSTGLPEAFSLKGLLPVAGALAGSVLFPPLAGSLGMSSLATGFLGSSIGAGLGGFAGGLLGGQSTGDALLGGAMSFGTGMLLGASGLTGQSMIGTEAANQAATAAAAGAEAAGSGITTQPALSGMTYGEGMLPGGYDAYTQLAKELPSGITAGEVPLMTPIPVAQPAPVSPGSPGIKPEPPKELSWWDKYISPDRPSLAADASIIEKYTPIAAVGTGALGLAGLAMEPGEAPDTTQQMAMMAPRETGYGTQRLVGGTPRGNVPISEQAALDVALGRSPKEPYLDPYRYAAQGGLVGLANGGMPSSQSAFSNTMDLNYNNQPSLRQNAANQAMGMFKSATGNTASTNPMIDMVEKSGAMDLRNLFNLEQTMRQQPQMVQQFLGQGQTPTPVAQQAQLQQQPRQQVLPYGLTSQPAAMQQTGTPIGQGGKGFGNLSGLAEGGEVAQPETPEGNGKYFEGRVVSETGGADGMSDDVLFEVEGDNPDKALLSRDEYVIPADVVAILGNGSSNAGSEKLDQIIRSIRKKAYDTEKQQKQVDFKGLQSIMMSKKNEAA